MANQLSKEIAAWYHQLETEWKESQEDCMLTMDEVVSLVESVKDSSIVFDGDYRTLAEVSGAQEVA